MKFAKIVVFLMFQTFIVNVFPDDSLQSLYRKVDAVKLSTDSAEIIKAYKYLGDYLSDMGDFEKSNQYLQQALHFAQQVRIDKEIGSIYNLLASNASYEGKRDAAISYYHKALKAFADIKDLDKVAMILINMGSEYEFSGNMKMAIAYKLKALKNKIASGETKNLDYYYQQVGQLFKETDKTKWEFYVRKAYEISRTTTITRIQTKAAIFNDLGGISKHLGKN